jgi:hypothetical protein
MLQATNGRLRGPTTMLLKAPIQWLYHRSKIARHISLSPASASGRRLAFRKSGLAGLEAKHQ